MIGENLKHFKPTPEQLEKWKRINRLSDEEWEKRCISYNDCSICPMAIRQFLFTKYTYTCSFGISEAEFNARMDNADIEF